MKPFIRILHLEDDPNDVELVQAMLKEAGLTCRITAVRSRNEFEEAMQLDGYDIILADFRLPSYDGMSAMRLVQKLRPDVPFVFVSGTMGEEAAIEGLKHGATDYVPKQKIMHIASAVERALYEAENRRERKRAQKALEESEAKMRSILENIGIGVALISPEMEIMELNTRMRQWFPAVDPGQRPICYHALNDPLREIICENCPTYKTLQDGRVHEAVMQMSPAGAIREYRIVSSPILDPSGEVTAAVTMFEDITERRQTQEDLQRSNDMLRAIIEAAPVAIIGLDLEGHVHSVWNPAAEKMLGWSAQEVMGRFLPTVPVEREEEFRGFREQIRSGKILDGIEVCRQRRDGTPIDYSIYSSPLHDANGHITGNIAVLVDITERKRAEDALRRSEKEKTILNQIANIFLTASDDAMYGDILAVVLQLMRSKYGIFGYVGENGDLIIPSLTRDIWNECRVSDKSIVFPSDSWGNSLWGRAIRDKKAFSSDGPFDTPEGHIPIDHFLTVPILYGNETIGVISVANGQQSYTEEDSEILESIAGYISPILNARLQRDRQQQKRKRAEETLRKLSRAVEQSPVSIVITDTEGSIEYVNPKFTEVTGYSQAEVLGKNPRILQSGELPKEFYKKLWETITSGREWHGEFHNRKKSGELYWESASISPIFYNSGAITHFVAVKEDITTRKRLEAQFRQAQKMESVGRLAGGVAHDFNNMLGVIIGRTELALDQLDPAQSLYSELQEIMKAAKRSADLTRQLLAFARKQTVAPKVLELNKIVEGILRMLRRLIGEDIDLAWLPGAELWPVKMDPSQIDQTLANLCVNARDAIGDVGKITIETANISFDRAYCADHPGFIPGEYVLLAVSDDGHGMDKETLDKIFEPFFTTKEMGKGTGLGLATVYGIVKQNNGFINVYSEPEHGTTFKIYLPRYAGMTEPLSKESPKIVGLRGHETILLVEDDPATLEMGKKMVERFGYQVLAASTPGDAIGLAKEHAGEIHLLITDVIMPEMNGPDLAKNLTSLCPGIKHLFMSGYTGDVIAHHGVLEEGENFIQKPFSMQTLAAKVREVLDSE